MKTYDTQQNRKIYLCFLFVVMAFVGMIESVYAFTPGEGGHIIDVPPFASTPNIIPGLYVSTNHRYPDWIGSGTHPVVNLNFPEPFTYGATSVTLQYSSDSGATWSNYQHYGADTTTDYNNFSIQPDGDYQYRLLVNGGPKNGYTSNVVVAHRSAIDTRFAGWGLDESMFIGGVMMPWVGRGLTASFIVHDIAGDSNIEGHIGYQWYRVNPATYEMISIAGATNETYITTIDDVGGYKLLCRGTGDGITVGGYAQVGSLGAGTTVVPNLAYVSNLTSHGFTLNLYKSIDSLLPEALNLTYHDPVTYEDIKLDVTGVTKIADAVYKVNVEIPLTVLSLYLQNSSDTWRIATAIGEEEWSMLHEGLAITFEATHTLTVNKTGTGTGEITEGGTYDHGTTQQISASAGEGSSFIGWSGDCSGKETPLNVLMDSDKICTATFQKKSSLLLFLPAIIKRQ